MPNRRLSPEEMKKLFDPLFRKTIQQLEKLSRGDQSLLFALRRKLFKELSYLERDKPSVRKRLKAKKRQDQQGKCTECGKALPERGAILDRFEAIDGYTDANTRLICPKCDHRIQSERGYA